MLVNGRATWAVRLGRAFVALFAGGLGLVWAVAAPAVDLMTDGVPREQYEGVNTIFHAVVMLGLMVLLPAISWVTYMFVVDPERPPWRALALSQLPSLAIAGTASLALIATRP